MGGFFKNEWNDVQSFYPPYDIHNLCGDYTETTIICHFLQKRYGYFPSIYIIQNLNIKRNG